MPRQKKNKSPSDPKSPAQGKAKKAPKARKKSKASPAAETRPTKGREHSSGAPQEAVNPLTALVAAAGEEADATEAVDVPARAGEPAGAEVPWSRIEIEDAHNPRKSFEDIEQLASSIEAGGVVTPLAVRPHPSKRGHFLLTAGERRWRAVRLLIETQRVGEDYAVPVHIRADDDQSALLAALVENIQRQDLAPLDEATAYDRLRKPPFSLSAGKIAKHVGMTRRHVLGRLQLLKLAPEVREALNGGEISFAVARVIAGVPEKLQRDALAHFRTAHPSFRTEDGIRNYIQGRAIHFDRALFNPEVYLKRRGEVYEPPAGGHKFFLDPDLFEQLQEDAIESEKIALQKQYEWVEVVREFSLPASYVRDPQGPGAVILIRGNLRDVEVVQGVRPAAPVKQAAPVSTASPNSSGAPAAARPEAVPASSAPAAEGPASAGSGVVPAPAGEDAGGATPTVAPPERPPVPPFVKTPTKTRSARAAVHRNRALQAAVAQSPDTALRLTIAGMLAGGGSTGVRLQLPPHDQRPPLSPAIEESLATLARFVGVGETADELLDAPWYRFKEDEVYECLLKAALPQLERIHRALVAATVGSWYPSARDATPRSPELVVRVASDLDAEVDDWEPTEEYFSEYTIAELRAIGEDLGIDLPKGGTKNELIRVLVASGKLNRYTPPELYFRSAN